MADFDVPIIAFVIGEGGSGGALGVAVADRVLILENAYYSVISPEVCRHFVEGPCVCLNAAEALKLDATELLNLGLLTKYYPNRLVVPTATGILPLRR